MNLTAMDMVVSSPKQTASNLLLVFLLTKNKNIEYVSMDIVAAKHCARMCLEFGYIMLRAAENTFYNERFLDDVLTELDKL